MPKKPQRFDPRQAMNVDSFEIFHYLDPESRHLEAHYHDFYEIYFFIDGNIDYWIDGSLYHLQPGDILLISPMQLHKPVPKGGLDKYERMVLWLDKQYLRKLEEGAFTACFERQLLRLSSEHRARLFGLGYEMHREYYAAEFGGNVCAYAILLQLLTQIIRISSVDKKAAERYSTPTLIAEILAYINEHFAQPMSLDSLASHFYINKYYLAHEFKSAVGTSLYRYITLKRLNTAYALLREGASATQVGAVCGFNDYTVFYRAFKAEYGFSPTQCGRL